MSKTRSAPALPVPSSAPSRRPPSPAARAGLLRAEVLDPGDGDTVLVRLCRAAMDEVLTAEIALPHYAPAAGDSVLVERGSDGWFVLGALGAARRRLPSELSVAEGDLTLSAPGRIVLRAEVVHTSSSEVLVEAGRSEVRAARLVERAGEAYRHVEGLLETTAGRARTLVRGDHDQHAGRTTITSEDDTLVDGKRVLLG